MPFQLQFIIKEVWIYFIVVTDPSANALSNMNTKKPSQNGWHFADENFKTNLLKKVGKSIEVSSICSSVYNWQLGVTGSAHGLLLNKQQAIPNTYMMYLLEKICVPYTQCIIKMWQKSLDPPASTSYKRQKQHPEWKGRNNIMILVL